MSGAAVVVHPGRAQRPAGRVGQQQRARGAVDRDAAIALAHRRCELAEHRKDAPPTRSPDPGPRRPLPSARAPAWRRRLGLDRRRPRRRRSRGHPRCRHRCRGRGALHAWPQALLARAGALVGRPQPGAKASRSPASGADRAWCAARGCPPPSRPTPGPSGTVPRARRAGRRNAGPDRRAVRAPSSSASARVP